MLKLCAVIFCAIIFACTLLIPTLTVVACRMGLVDKPRGRNLHQETMPFVGSIAIFQTILCAVAFGPQDFPLFLGLGALLLIGKHDDLFDMARIKTLLVQIGIKLA